MQTWLVLNLKIAENARLPWIFQYGGVG